MLEPLGGETKTRRVYDLGDAVLKVDAGRAGYAGNCATEAWVWEHATDEERLLLAPVLAHGRGWLVMAKVAPVHGKTPPELFSGLRAMGVCDVRGHNWGWLGGRAVAFDYAYVLSPRRWTWTASTKPLPEGEPT